MTDLTLRAWAYLSRVVEPPCAELAALVSGVGPIEAAERVRRGQVDDVLARHTEARREIDRAADDLELLSAQTPQRRRPGITGRTTGSPGRPPVRHFVATTADNLLGGFAVADSILDSSGGLAL